MAANADGRSGAVVSRHTHLSRKLYALLLSFYPRGLRDGFADAQAQAFDDWLDDERAARGLGGVIGVWRIAAADWAWSMALAYREAASLVATIRFASSACLLISLAMWALIGASMLGHLAWATNIVETHTARNTWIALGGPCAALVTAALVNPWQSRRVSSKLAVTAVVCALAWLLALSTWHG